MSQVACTNKYAKEKDSTFSAKFHAVLLKHNRDYLLSNTLIIIITIYQRFCCIARLLLLFFLQNNNFNGFRYVFYSS